MKHILSWCFLLIVFEGLIIDNIQADPPGSFGDGEGVIKVNRERFVSLFRKAHWCVNGLDEPEFQRYPLNQFAPYIHRADRFITPKNAQFKYTIELKQVKLAVENFHVQGQLLNTAHFNFTAWRKKLFAESTQLEYAEVDIEGVIIQMNYAPYGVGLPFGDFLRQGDIPCSDCVHPQGRPVACKHKTWMHFMHPTLLVYHHEMRVTPEEKKLHMLQEQEKYGQKFCLRDDSIKFSGAIKCTTNAGCSSGLKCRFPIPQKYCVSGASKTDTSKICKANSDCKIESDPPESCVQESIESKVGFEDYAFKPKEFLGKTSQVHSNLVWHTYPCHSTRVVRFMILVVHSFSKGLYYVFQTESAYNLPGIVDDKRNPLYAPSPVFSGFIHTCDSNKEIDYNLVENVDGNIDFDVSKSYEMCILNQSKVEDTYCYNDAPKFKSTKFIPPPLCSTPTSTDQDKALETLLESSISKRSCPPCPVMATTTKLTTTTTKPPLIKRDFHGGINFVTNFCVMPITVFIARFYKETFNLHSFKGDRLWYWLHLFGSGGSSILMYFGYFNKGFIQDWNPHVIYGNIYIMILAFAYITAWVRHKNPKISGLAEVIHGVSGYSCFALAICCTLTVEELHPSIKIFVFTSISILGVFYIGMTAHICALDARFGMKPRRSHFPTVEIRFDDLPVPGNTGRIVVLILLSIVVLILCLATIFY